MPHKFRAYVGGYGSGKSWAGVTAMCARYWSHPIINQGYFAPTYPHIRDIYYPLIDEVSATIGLRADIKEGNKEVHIYSGKKYRGTTICRSMDNPGSIIGFKIGHAMVDEFDVLPNDKAKQAWRKIIARLRWKGAKNGADVTTTPEGFKETHRLFVDQVSKEPRLGKQYGIVHASTLDNEANLPEGYIQSLIDTYPQELIDAYINGQFCNLTSGTVYNCYNRKTNESKEKIDGKEPLLIGMDFNVGKMAASIFVKRENGVHAVAELKDIFDTPSIIRIIKDKWNGNRIVIYPDASGNSKKSVDASSSDIALLRGAGFEVRVNPSNPRVRDRILATNKQFEINQLFVNSKNCPNIAKCLEQQAYDDNGEPDKKSGFDHLNDAFSYVISYEFPIIDRMRMFRIGGI